MKEQRNKDYKEDKQFYDKLKRDEQIDKIYEEYSKKGYKIFKKSLLIAFIPSSLALTFLIYTFSDSLTNPQVKKYSNLKTAYSRLIQEKEIVIPNVNIAVKEWERIKSNNLEKAIESVERDIKIREQEPVIQAYISREKSDDIKMGLATGGGIVGGISSLIFGAYLQTRNRKRRDKEIKELKVCSA